MEQIPDGIPEPTGDLPVGNRPQLADAYDIGRGVHQSAPEEFGKDVRPRLECAYDIGQGVHQSAPEEYALSQQVPCLGAWYGKPALAGVLNPAPGSTCAARRAWLCDWFSRLRDRLRLVRVCCGDWSRVCSSESVTTRLGRTGVFLDPPYGAKAKRSKKLYSQDSLTVADEVRRWCLERGADPLMRICLAGYTGEGHEELEAHGWRVVAWHAQGGYGNRSDTGKANAKKERLWFSPHCTYQRTLFDVPWSGDEDSAP